MFNRKWNFKTVHYSCAMLMYQSEDWWFGVVDWIPGISLWKGVLLRGTPGIPNHQPKPPIYHSLNIGVCQKMTCRHQHSPMNHFIEYLPYDQLILIMSSKGMSSWFLKTFPEMVMHKHPFIPSYEHRNPIGGNEASRTVWKLSNPRFKDLWPKSWFHTTLGALKN